MKLENTVAGLGPGAGIRRELIGHKYCFTDGVGNEITGYSRWSCPRLLLDCLPVRW